jgi:hypothetical protein
MFFNSLVFLGFITIVFLVYPRLRLRGQNVFLLVASYFFYGYWDWRFTSLLFTSTVIEFWIGQKLHASGSQKRKRLMISTFCKKEQIPLLDPRQALKERHALVPCYFVYDGHWIGEGIRVATVSIARQWRDLGLPPWNRGYPELENKSS